MKLLILYIVALLPLVVHGQARSPAPSFAIDASFPGGNVLVARVDGDTIHLAPDKRDSMVPWFYWYFRVTGAAGRTLTFVFDKANIGVRGPGVSVDAGKSWKWLGADVVQDGTFSFAFPPKAHDVRFSVGMPYVQGDLDRCLQRHKGNPFLHLEQLTKTRKSREVPLIRVSDPAKKARYAIAITARHHCCEMMASYTLEGLMEGALADDAAGRWLREHAEFLFVPFMDVDGVEDGDQGKNRSPFDHNRDYATNVPRYPEVAALKERLPAWSAGRPMVFLDLHDPALRNDIHEVLHFLEPEDKIQAGRLDALCTHLEREQQGPILYRKSGNLRFGSGYNKITAQPAPISSGWARSLPNTLLGCTVEIPYANANGCEVNAESAREFGRDLAVTLMKFLQDQTGKTTDK
ncbi:zinc carboxypeptidase [Roseimicrobium gellanilyticum]|uniref:Zinc carboxypeptidase n=1 Tax=Roseimicrobium gellanilyticum TaxID=748857 RepID=A0A366HQV4_9BACT|nr:M14-type cytosolic carboxypeptidase [Roseimicrobium gellanilyticum]RBP46040.1 zinc carboxypeptidase [Roseimicrobium gellanilyticum]